MDRKTILAFVLIGLVIIITPYYFKLVAPVPPERPTDIPSSAQSREQIPDPTPLQTKESAWTDFSQSGIEKPAEPEIRGLEKVSRNRLVLESNLYRIVLSNTNGGTFERYILKEYEKRTRTDTSTVQLIPKRYRDLPLTLEFATLDGDSLVLNMPFRITSSTRSIPPDSTILLGENESFGITFSIEKDGRHFASKTLTFYGNSYTIDLSVDITGASGYIPTNEYRLSWKTGLNSTEANFDDDMAYAKAYAYQGGELEEIDAQKGEYQTSQLDGSTDWTAIRTKYFVTSLVPEKPAGAFLLTASAVDVPGEHKRPFKLYSMALDMPVGDGEQHNYTLYIGPLDYKRIKTLNVHLERIMDFGWSLIRPISKGILSLFTTMHKAIPNYGIVLIIFAVLIKVILYPLTHKSFESMKQMQQLQPLIAELKEKYPKDPQRLQRETMRLYKEYKVNPLGGCLPMLFQLPLLWALFIVFRTTIELRNAGFFWWITDLSSPDTIFVLPFSIPIYGNTVNVLPLIMGLTMILQQKLSTAPSNPQQKLMLYFMPIFFFLLFNQFPSGLNLYYTLFNILSILQQKYLVKTPELKPVQPSKKSGKKPGKR